MSDVPDKSVEQFGQDTGGGSGGEGVLEYDPDAAQAEDLDVQAAEPGDGAVIPDEGWLKARDELEAILGGADAMLAATAEAGSPDRLGMENIQGIGVGFRTAGGYDTGELAVKVYVTEKAVVSRVDSATLVPPEVNGYAVDVEAVGEFHAYVYKGRYPRPVPCGVSIGHGNITAGTLGCLVVLNNNRLCILSNNHVLANTNNAKRGDPILQPGPIDGGRMPQDRIGVLERFVPISFTGPNLVDAAAAWTSFSLVKPAHVTYKMDPNPLAPSLGLSVMKNGRTTQATRGTITGFPVNNVRVNYNNGKIALFNNQIFIKSPFSAGGDSGSIVVSAGTRRPVGLLFAGSATHTVASLIGNVKSQLGISRFVGG